MIKTSFSEKLLSFVDSNEFDKADQYWKEQTTDYVYKYIKLGQSYDKNNIEALFCNKLYFNYVRNFDDKKEFQNVEYQYKTQIGRYLFEKEKRNRLNRNLVSCFCGEIKDDSEMWKEYANDGNGIKCKFKVLKNEYILKVCYSDKIYYIEELNDSSKEKQKIRNCFLRKLSYCLKKSSEWKYQDEYRIIIDFENNILPIQVLRFPNNYVLISDILKLEAIEVGEKVDEDNTKRIIDLSKEKNIEWKARSLKQ